MSNKFFSIIVAAAVCGAMIPLQAFAEDITTNVSIYAPNAEEIAEHINDVLFERYDVNVKEDTIMPVYQASIYDYAKTGMFEFVPETSFGGQSYFADTVDENGNFAGALLFTDDGEHSEVQIYMTHKYDLYDNASRAIDYRANVDRISRLMLENDISTNITNAKISWVEGMGFVYYITNGTSEILVRANFKGGGDEFLNAENGGIVVVNDEFKAAVDKKLAEMIALEEMYEGNPLTGGAASSDSNNPKTGGTSSGVAAASVLAACGAVLTAFKKNRK